MTATLTVVAGARLPDDLADDVLTIAARDGVSESDVIRIALRDYCDRELGRTLPVLFANTAGAARRSDPATAKRAAQDVQPRTGSQRHRILELYAHAALARVADVRVGLTADEVCAALERQHRGHVAVNGVAKRVSELYHAGAILPHLDSDGDDVTRKTRNGSDATVYTITTKGHAWLTAAQEPPA